MYVNAHREANIRVREHRARRKSLGPGGEVNPYFTPPPPVASSQPHHHHHHYGHQQCHQHRHDAFACFASPPTSLLLPHRHLHPPTTYIHPLKDHAPARNSGWGLESTRSKGVRAVSSTGHARHRTIFFSSLSSLHSCSFLPLSPRRRQ